MDSSRVIFVPYEIKNISIFYFIIFSLHCISGAKSCWINCLRNNPSALHIWIVKFLDWKFWNLLKEQNIYIPSFCLWSTNISQKFNYLPQGKPEYAVMKDLPQTFEKWEQSYKYSEGYLSYWTPYFLLLSIYHLLSALRLSCIKSHDSKRWTTLKKLSRLYCQTEIKAQFCLKAFDVETGAWDFRFVNFVSFDYANKIKSSFINYY